MLEICKKCGREFEIVEGDNGIGGTCFISDACCKCQTQKTISLDKFLTEEYLEKIDSHLSTLRLKRSLRVGKPTH